MSRKSLEFWRSPQGRFLTQKKNAKRRDIEFNLTFDQWWKVWQDSGHWEERGRNRGQYAMTRPGDTGPYSVDNVVIKTVLDNSLETFSDPIRRKQHSERISCSLMGNDYALGNKLGPDPSKDAIVKDRRAK